MPKEIKPEISKIPEEGVEREILPERKLEEIPKPEGVEGVIEKEEAVRKETEKKPLMEEIEREVKEIKTMDQERQVKVLCDLALKKGRDYAIKIARSLDNAFVLDEFHKELTGKLRE